MSAVSTLEDLQTRRINLAPITVGTRAARIRARLVELEIDAVILTTPSNIRWSTGFTGSAGMVVITSDSLHLITDGRYSEQAEQQLAQSQCVGEVVITQSAQLSMIAKALGNARRVGLEADSVTWAQQQRFADALSAELVPTTAAIEKLRRVKDDSELARIELAADIADFALAKVRHLLDDGLTEKQFALALDTEMRAAGASGNSFTTIVASGPNGALPHARPTERTISAGDLVVIDFGCVIDGYCSDMTRSVGIGEISAEQTRMLEVIKAANAAGVAAIAAGQTTAAVDRAARSVVEDAGWGEAFVHGTGHGVGLDIHEAPRVSSASEEVLALGEVVTVEPGVYLPALGGVRTEDLLVVTEEGCRSLSKSPKSFQP